MRRSCSALLLVFAVACQDRGDDPSAEPESGSTSEAAADTDDGSEETGEDTDADPDTDTDTDDGTSTGAEEPDPMAEPGPLSERDCPEDSVLTADNFGMPFMLNWCAGCHSSQLEAGERAQAPVGIDFDTLDGVRTHLERVYIRTAQTGANMPPASGPPLAERQQLADWLACGAPE